MIIICTMKILIKLKKKVKMLFIGIKLDQAKEKQDIIIAEHYIDFNV